MTAWRRFAATPGARFGLAVLLAFVLVGAGADLIAHDSHTLIPYGPDEQHPGGVSSVLSDLFVRYYL